MSKEKIFNAVKIMIITFLVIAISILVIMKWKSDVIMDKVMSSLQDQLTDSLQYSEADMDWFSYFPSTAIHISDLRVGSGKSALLKGGSVDVVIRLWPLMKGNIIINQLQVMNSTIHLTQKEGRWSYDITKESAPSNNKEAFTTEIRKLVIENSELIYDDGNALSLTLKISESVYKGSMQNEKLEMSIDMTSTLAGLAMNGYQQTVPFPFTLKGNYTFDMLSGLQEYKDWQLENNAIQMSANGTIMEESAHNVIDMAVSWKKAYPEVLKKWLPEKLLETWKEYTLSGECEGEAKIEGRSSEIESPHISSTFSLKNGGITFLKAEEEIKGLSVDVSYDSGNKKQKSALAITFKKSAVFGSSLEGNVKVQNLENPVFDISLSGSLPSGLLNLASFSDLDFDNGSFEIDHFELNGFHPGTSSLKSFFAHGKTSLKTNNLSFSYVNNKIALISGSIILEGGKLSLDLDQFTWNNVTVADLMGSISTHEDALDFRLDGKLCEGKVETNGTITGLNHRPVSNATWKVTGIEMKQLLESFSNFDQTFITSENLKGKTNIWAESTIPFDDKWNMVTDNVLVRSAIEISDGQLKGMKTLEDFSKYVHLDDLRDIRFNQLRNYMKIENGTVYLPVMFIQSSALNMSISGEHGFDEDILYYLKLNAGQVAANKLKKNDVGKDYKKASKSGWINMYFILRGNTSDVQYQQYRNAVIAGFEQSTSLKENLRNSLVEKFGYDVYWLEPNEWEDIPEYK